MTKNIAALGSHPTPEDLLEVIDEENLEEEREGLVRNFFEKVDWIKDEYDTFEDFRDSVLVGDIRYNFLEEKYLQQFLLENFNNFFKDLQKYYVDDSCSEVPLGNAGRCDILAKNRETGDLVVIELKREVASSRAVGQILSYITGAQKEIAKDGQDVKAILVAKDFDDSFLSAIERTEDEISLKKYNLHFDLQKVNQ